MKTINVAEATNIQLDWLVAKLWGLEFDENNQPLWFDGEDSFSPRVTWSPTTRGDHMVPIIERGPISTKYWDAAWTATMLYENDDTADVFQAEAHGETFLVAAARCYVMSKMGETVEVPEELA